MLSQKPEGKLYVGFQMGFIKELDLNPGLEPLAEVIRRHGQLRYA